MSCRYPLACALRRSHRTEIGELHFDTGTRYAQPDPRGGGVPARGVAGDHDHVMPGTGEPQRDPAADAAGGAGHDGDLLLAFIHAGLTLRNGVNGAGMALSLSPMQWGS